MALAGTCRSALSRSWLCIASATAPAAIANAGAVRTKTTQICEPILSEASINSAAKPVAVDAAGDDDVIERHVEHVDELPADAPKMVADAPREEKFQPIDMASLAPGLAPPPQNTVSQKSQKWCELNYETLYAMMNRGNIWLVDVREKAEVQKAGMIPQSINIPLSTLKRALLQDSDDFYSQYGIPKPGKTDEYIVFYSLNHVKGVTALEIAHRLGFRKARQYAGGYEDWISKQMELMDAQANAQEF